MVARAAQNLGPVQVLVANAAAMAMSPFLDADPAQWWRQVDVNLSGHFRLIQAVVPGMRALGHGRVIVITSGWGVIGHPNATAYAASKSGLIALTKGLGRELGPDGILANALAPAFIDTEQLLVDAQDAGISLEEMRQRYRDLVPGRQARDDRRHRRRHLLPGRPRVHRVRRAGAAAHRRSHENACLTRPSGRPDVTPLAGPLIRGRFSCLTAAPSPARSTAGSCRASPAPRPSPGCPRSTGSPTMTSPCSESPSTAAPPTGQARGSGRPPSARRPGTCGQATMWSWTASR